jgi:hypothetical protein
VDRTVCLSNESEKQEIIFVQQSDDPEVFRTELFEAMKEMANHGG